MPSFHTVLAILFTYAHRPPSRSFIPVAMLNLVMLVSIPFAGHHYVIDMIAGAALAAATIAIVRAVRLSGRSEIVIASDSET
jgi:membrane-associated phospholipid phosphatase